MNYLYNSKEWMDYLENNFDECQDYFKFAMVWMSFNSYFALKYKDINTEEKQILQFIKDNKNIFDNLKKNEEKFRNVLNEFKATGWLAGHTGERTCVADERYDNQKQFFNDKNSSCEHFFMVLYQIRCNFFHGNKKISDEGNKKIIKWAYKYLNIFWKEFLDQEG